MLKDLRKKSRDSLVAAFADSVYVSMYLIFVASVIGAFVSLRGRYKDQLVSEFVSSNLPALGPPSEQITWENFEHIAQGVTPGSSLGGAESPLASPLVERVDLYDDFAIIRLKTPWDRLKAQQYLGFYPSKQVPNGERADDPIASTMLGQAEAVQGGHETKGRHAGSPLDGPSGNEHGAINILGMPSAKAPRWLTISARGRIHLSPRSLPLAFDLPNLDSGSSQRPVGKAVQSTPVVDWASQLCNLLDEVPHKLGSSRRYSPDSSPRAINRALSSLTPREASRVVALAIEDQLALSPERHGTAPGAASDHGRLLASQIGDHGGALGSKAIDTGVGAVRDNAALRTSASRQLMSVPSNEVFTTIPLGSSEAPFLTLPGTPLVGVNNSPYRRGGQAHHLDASTPSHLPGNGGTHAQLRQQLLRGSLAAPGLQSVALHATQSDARGGDHSIQAGCERSQREVFWEEIGQFAGMPVEPRGPELLHALLTEADWEASRSLLAGNGPRLAASTKGLHLDEDAMVTEEGAVIVGEASEVASEEVLDLLNEALADVVDKPRVQPIDPRVMSGYRHPGLTPKEIRQHLSRLLLSNGLQLGDAAARSLLVDKEVLLPSSPALQMPMERLQSRVKDLPPLAPSSHVRTAMEAPSLDNNGESSIQAVRVGVAEGEVRDLSSVEQSDLRAQNGRGGVPKRQERPRVRPELPIAEIGYETVCFTGSGALKELLSELGVGVGEGALDDVPILEPAFLGPAIARNDSRTEVTTWQGAELAEWVVEAMLGETSMAAGTALPASNLTSRQHPPLRWPGAANEPLPANRLPSSVPSIGSALLPDRQSSFLGKREVVRGNGLTIEDRLAGLRSKLAASPLPSNRSSLERGNSTVLEERDGTSSLQPMKTNQMLADLLVRGVGPTPRDPSYDPLLGINAKDNPEEGDYFLDPAIFTKIYPLFEANREMLALSAEEWHRVFKALVAQALDDQASLKQIKLLLPSLVVVDGAPRRDVVSAMLLPKGQSGTGEGAWWSAVSERQGHTPSPPAHLKAARQWRCPLTVQEYASFAQLIERSRGFVSENHSSAADREGLLAIPALQNRGLPAAQSDARGRTELAKWLNGKWSGMAPSLAIQPQAPYRPSLGYGSSPAEQVGGRGSLAAPSMARGGQRAPGHRRDGSSSRLGPKLLHHGLPATQVATLDSAPRVPFARGRYQRRLTSFAERHPLEGEVRTINADKARKRVGAPLSALPGEAAIGPRMGQRRPVFRQLWEPVTGNSWMILYQLCFGFWMLELARDYYRRCGKEFILYIVDLLTALGFNAKRIIEDLGLAESSMRVITNGRRRFADIAGIDSVLPQLGEVVWFLRSSGRGGHIPTGLLLVGPPGTGKTFLVQAIAGEAKVPVIVQSASSFNDPSQNDSGTQMLRDLFDKARQIAPCILFIDEIDTLAVARPHITGDPMEKDGLLESLNQGAMGTANASLFNGSKGGKMDQSDGGPAEMAPYQGFYPSPGASDESMLDGDEDEQPEHDAPVFRAGDEDSPGLDPSLVEVLESHNELRRSRQQRLALLMQFLMEMDGIRSRQGVVVIGATNRPGVLDPAFTRPGRFERVVCLQLPSKQKRVEILQLYTKRLGVLNPMRDAGSLDGTWQYLANRTAGLSAAHLASAMNQSAIQAIIRGTAHTIETIEHGISAVARRSFEDISYYTSVVDGTQHKGERVGDCWTVYHSPTVGARSWWETLSLGEGGSDTAAPGSRGGGPHDDTSLPQDEHRKALEPGGGQAHPGGGQAHPGGGQAHPGGGQAHPGGGQAHPGGGQAHPGGGQAHPSPPLAAVPTASLVGRRIELLIEVGLGAMTGPNLQLATSGRQAASLLARSSYYQAGKAIVHTALPLHPPASFLPLHPEPFTSSSSDLSELVASRSQSSPFEPQRRVVLETRLIGLYAGKASELLALAGFGGEGGKVPHQPAQPVTVSTEPLINMKGEEPLPMSLAGEFPNRGIGSNTASSQSDLGVEELTFAGVVADCMVSSWYLYSKRLSIQDMSLASTSQDTKEIDDPVLLDMLSHLAEENEHEVQRATKLPLRYQQPAPPSWWQAQVAAEEALMERADAEWYRIHLPDPEESERNIDWVPPEDNYHAVGTNRMQDLAHGHTRRIRGLARNIPSKGKRRVREGAAQPHSVAPGARTWGKAVERGLQGDLSNSLNRVALTPSIQPAVTWNDLYLMNRDYLYHGLITSCFFKAFGVLDTTRELLDHLSDHLIRHGLLREYEIAHIAALFGIEEPAVSGRGARTEVGMERDGSPALPTARVTGQDNRFEGIEQPSRPNRGQPLSGNATDGLAYGPQGLEQGNKGQSPPSWAVVGKPTQGVDLGETPRKEQPEVPQPSEGLERTGLAQADSTSVGMPSERDRGKQRPRRLPIDELPDPVQLAREEWSLRWGRKISRFVDFDFVKPCYIRLPKRKR